MLDGFGLSHVLKPMEHRGATLRQLDTLDWVLLDEYTHVPGFQSFFSFCINLNWLH